MPTPIPTNRATLTADSAAAVSRGTVVQRGAAVESRGITTDSRAVWPGCAFVALRGERFDGHDYLPGAIEAGASLLVVERGRAPGRGHASVVEVDDTLVAWGDFARAHLQAWRAAALPGEPRRVIAVTGSAGKTTTKELCAALLGAVAPVHATRGNLNNRIGVPAVVLGVEDGHRFAVIEAGMSLRGEIAALASILEPDVAVLTNVGLAHAGGVGGTRADVAREKGDLFAALSSEGAAIACADDDEALAQLQRTSAARKWTFGVAQGADFQLVERAADGVAGARVRIRRRDGSSIRVWLPILGEAAAVDLAGALAAAEAVAGALAEEVVTTGLRSLAAFPAGRMQVKELSDGTTILDDTYNANPQSMRAALGTLREVAHGRRAVVVLGEMRELGESAAQEHAALGASVVAAGATIAVSCGGLADRSVAEAERHGVTAAYATDAVGAARLATTLIRPGDVILVKASRSVGAERVVEALLASRSSTGAGPGAR